MQVHLDSMRIILFLIGVCAQYVIRKHPASEMGELHGLMLIDVSRDFLAEEWIVCCGRLLDLCVMGHN